jgi:hypothetical protein
MSGSLGAKKDWWRDQRRFAKDIIRCHPIKYAPCNCHWPCGRCSKFISTFVANLLTSLGTSSLRVSLLGGRSFFAYCQRWRRGFLLQSILSASFHYFVPHLLKPGRRRRFRSHQMVSAQIIGKKKAHENRALRIFRTLGTRMSFPEWLPIQVRERPSTTFRGASTHGSSHKRRFRWLGSALGPQRNVIQWFL